jgi:hypothetical protein
MNAVTVIEAARIASSVRSLPRYRTREPEHLTLIDRLLWTPMPYDTVLEFHESLPPGTQLGLFHPCAHCGVGLSGSVPQHCNHCQRYLTKWMVARGWWAQGWRYRLAAGLWVVNYEMKEARRKAREDVAHLLMGAVMEIASHHERALRLPR